MRKIFILVALAIPAVFIGCAATADRPAEVMSLEAKVSTLEAQVQQLQAQQGKLEREIVNQSKQQAALKKTIEGPGGHALPAPTNKEIQTALKNAGYYDGPIDGKIGGKTRNAIMEFQSRNDLKVDGLVGSGTWELLKVFLHKVE